MDIQAGDKITYIYLKENKKVTAIVACNSEAKDLQNMQKEGSEHQIKILKIERPKYEVIEEKKELLTEEEKEFLKQTLKFGNYNGAVKFIVRMGYFLKLHFNDWHCNTVYIDKKVYFKELVEDNKYTLEELGLE